MLMLRTFWKTLTLGKIKSFLDFFFPFFMTKFPHSDISLPKIYALPTFQAVNTQYISLNDSMKTLDYKI